MGSSGGSWLPATERRPAPNSRGGRAGPRAATRRTHARFCSGELLANRCTGEQRRYLRAANKKRGGGERNICPDWRARPAGARHSTWPPTSIGNHPYGHGAA
eukprot:11470750-Alexandrium_andersonii.AAC.1